VKAAGMEGMKGMPDDGLDRLDRVHHSALNVCPCLSQPHGLWVAAKGNGLPFA
jgi:hypothetical protein